MLWYCINANIFFYTSCMSLSAEDKKLHLHWCIWNHIRAMSSFHAVRNPLLSSVNTASGCAGWPASSSLSFHSLQVSPPCSPASYVLFPTSCASPVCIHLSVGLVSKFHAQDHTAGSVYTLSRATFTHQPHRIILKWTQSIPRQTPHVLLTQPVVLQHRKGWQHYKPPAQELESGHSQSRVLIHSYTQAKN